MPVRHSEPGALRSRPRRSPLIPSALLLVALGCASSAPHREPDPDEAPAMTSTQPHEHHAIDYIEFTVSDVAEAKRFYGAAFGWQFNDYGPDYAGIQRTGGGEVGGMRLDTTVPSGGPLVVLFSEDLEASVKAVEDAGGRIVVEPFAFPGGRRFHFADPFGNELAVYSIE